MGTGLIDVAGGRIVEGSHTESCLVMVCTEVVAGQPELFPLGQPYSVETEFCSYQVKEAAAAAVRLCAGGQAVRFVVHGSHLSTCDVYQ